MLEEHKPAFTPAQPTPESALAALGFLQSSVHWPSSPSMSPPVGSSHPVLGWNPVFPLMELLKGILMAPSTHFSQPVIVGLVKQPWKLKESKLEFEKGLQMHFCGSEANQYG